MIQSSLCPDTVTCVLTKLCSRIPVCHVSFTQVIIHIIPESASNSVVGMRVLEDCTRICGTGRMFLFWIRKWRAAEETMISELVILHGVQKQ